jgi:F-box protein 11
LNDPVCQTVCEMVKQHAPSTWQDPQRCIALLKDLLGGNTRYQREINVLAFALSDGAMSELQQQTRQQIPPEIVVKRLAQRLHADRGLDQDLARWAMDVWAKALVAYEPSNWQQNRSDSEIITVSSSGSGQYATIDEALQNAQSGDTILVKPGSYTETITITQPVEIVGDGAVEQIVVSTNGAPCLRMQTDMAVVRGLTLQTHAGKERQQLSAVEISRGRLELTDCQITSECGPGISISGPATNPSIQRCTLVQCKEGGLLISEQAQGNIEHCVIRNNNRAGIIITQKSHPTLRACTISENRTVGILVYDHGEGQILQCDIFANTVAAVEIRQGGNPLIQGCTLHKETGKGILIWEHGQGRIEDCDIANNILAGIEIRTGGNPVVRNCKIHDSKWSGLLIWEHGRGIIEACDIFNNTLAEVEIRQGGDPLLKNCTLHSGKGRGLLVHEQGRGRIEACDIFDMAQVGVEIRQQGDPSLQGCKIHDMWRIGVQIMDEGRGTLKQCEITRNPIVGINIKQGGHPLLQHCSIHNSRGIGVCSATRGQGKLIDCDLFQLAGLAIEIKPGGQLDLQQCRLNHNDQDIMIHDGGYGTRDGIALTN